LVRSVQPSISLPFVSIASTKGFSFALVGARLRKIDAMPFIASPARRERDTLMAMEAGARAKAGDHFFPLRGVGLFGRARPKRAVVARLGE
jgi:hypothetical protein